MTYTAMQRSNFGTIDGQLCSKVVFTFAATVCIKADGNLPVLMCTIARTTDDKVFLAAATAAMFTIFIVAVQGTINGAVATLSKLRRKGGRAESPLSFKLEVHVKALTCLHAILPSYLVPWPSS